MNTRHMASQDVLVSIGILFTGLLIAWCGEPAGLLTFAILFRFLLGRARVAVFLLLALLFASTLLALAFVPGSIREDLLRYAALCVVTICLGWAIAPGRQRQAFAHDLGAHRIDLPPVFQDFHPDDRAAAARAAAHAFWTGVPQVIPCRRLQSDGSYDWTEYCAEPGYDVRIAIDAMVARSGDLWTTASSLGETVEAVRSAFVIERLLGKAWAFDAQGKFTYVTPTGQIAIGMTLEDLNLPVRGGAFIDGGDVGWSRGVHPHDYEAAAASLRHSLRTGDPWNVEYRMLRTTGQYVWHRISARATRDDEDRITGWYGTSIDIDVYKRTEAALIESERSLRQLIETVPALIWCMTPEGEPIYFSRHLRDFFGFDVEDRDIPGKSRLECILGAVIHPDDLDKVNQRFEHSLGTGDTYSLTHRQRRFDGVYRWVETRIAAMLGEDGVIVQWNGVCLDIEEQVRAQEELRQVQGKLARAAQAASLAELSASIAHEVNQPLAAIMTNAQACRRWLVAEPPNVERARAIVDRITRSAQSAADVVSHVRALFSQSAGPRIVSAVELLVGEVVDLLSEEAMRLGVLLEVDVASNLPPVAIDPVQIQQVFVNLLRNGMEAMADVEGQKRLVLSVCADVDDMLRIEVADCGAGIVEPDRIFDPFFTTKSNGMGMGLAICRSIVETHGGILSALANEPTGARLVFTLPTVTRQ